MALTNEEVEKRMMELLRGGRRDECAAFLAEQREEANLSGRIEDAGHLSSKLGSILFSVGRNEEALLAFRYAEANSPSPWATLRTARHLLWSLGHTAEAAEKVKHVLNSSPTDSQEHLEARALEGCVSLALGDSANAIRAFRELADSKLLARTPVIAWDFALVEELSQQRLVVDELREFLGRALAKAREEADDRTEARILKILATLAV